MSDNGSTDTEVTPKETKETNDLFPEKDYFMNESKSDVIFIIDGQRVPAEKHILMLGSVYFRAMFSGSFAESEKQEIEIKDTTYEAFKAVVWFLYSRDLSFKDNEDIDCNLVTDVCKVADAYHLPRLLETIGKYLKKEISIKNLPFISKIAFNYRIEELDSRVKRFIDSHYNRIIAKDLDYLTKLNESTSGHLLSQLVPKGRKLVALEERHCYECKESVENIDFDNRKEYKEWLNNNTDLDYDY